MAKRKAMSSAYSTAMAPRYKRTVLGYNRAAGGLTSAARYRGNKAAIKKVIRSVMEKKGVDTILTVSSVLLTTNTNAGSFVLNLIQAGNGSWNRVGRKVNLTHVRLTGIARLTYEAAATTGVVAGSTLRMVVVWDKQPSGAAIPSFDVIFGSTVQDGTEATAYLDSIKYDQMDRFSILRDCRIQMNPPTDNNQGGTSDQVSQDYPFDEFIKLNNREVVFSGQSAPMTIADISTGAIYVFFRSNANSGANTVSITSDSKSRLRYQDP